MAERLAVIMPAWNAADYIESSVRSVLEQTHRELRLIVVDDGSTDRTPEILARLAAEDERLTVMRVPNGGPAMARNRALDALGDTADYVMFLDADDLLDPDAAEYALAAARKGAEFVIFGFRIVRPDGSAREYREREELLDRASLGGSLARLYKANLLNQVWGKLFAAPLLKEIRFPDYRWGEDRLFLFDVLGSVRRLAVLPACRHSYRMHPGESLIKSWYDRKFAVAVEIDRRMEALCREFSVPDDADFRYMFAKSVFSCLTTLYSPNCRLSAAEKRAAIREMLREPRLRERMSGASGGLPVRVLSVVVLSERPGWIAFVFRLVAWAGERFPKLFTKIKHRK